MKDWNKLTADENKILTKHYTKGRSGGKIKYVVVHHNAGNLSIQGCWNVWQNREASAHYQVDINGRIGQLVHDANTAWHAGNWTANCNSIGIEHADSKSNPWTISDKTLDNGAHLVAAVCKYYKLGRPAWGKNVFPHNHFQATACPASIYGKQKDKYMATAQKYYDAMVGKKTTSTASSKPAASKGTTSKAILAVDGSCGASTIRQWQKVMHTTVDGIISSQVVPDSTYARPNLVTAQVRYGCGGSDLIRAVQKKLHVTADGYFGKNTIKALQKYLKVTVDGSFGVGTVKALQKRLNTNKF